MLDILLWLDSLSVLDFTVVMFAYCIISLLVTGLFESVLLFWICFAFYIFAMVSYIF